LVAGGKEYQDERVEPGGDNFRAVVVHGFDVT
jgi:hypothetical protein